jgi:hypothetical protein
MNDVRLKKQPHFFEIWIPIQDLQQVLQWTIGGWKLKWLQLQKWLYKTMKPFITKLRSNGGTCKT